MALKILLKIDKILISNQDSKTEWQLLWFYKEKDFKSEDSFK